MHDKTWTLTNTSRNIHESPFSVGAAEVASAKGNWRISQRTFHGGLQEGVDLVEIDNGRMRIYVLPTRGMGIWRAEIGEHTLGWRSPVRGPVHPMFVPITDQSGLGWLEGFDELIVRCGLESNGAPEFDEQGRLVYPLHGRIANRPASFVEVTVDEAAGTITLRGVVEETRFHFQKLRLTATLSTAFNSTSFSISDEVENFGGTPAQMQMLYHINVGEPLLVPGSQVVAAVQSIETLAAKPPAEGWETMGPAVAASPEECYLMRLRANESGRTQVLVKNSDGTAGTALDFNTKQLPCFTLWKNMVASADGYVTGIEPGTNFPKQRSTEVEAGRVVRLEPSNSWKAEYTLNWLTSASEVSATEQVIRCL